MACHHSSCRTTRSLLRSHPAGGFSCYPSRRPSATSARGQASRQLTPRSKARVLVGTPSLGSSRQECRKTCMPYVYEASSADSEAHTFRAGQKSAGPDHPAAATSTHHTCDSTQCQDRSTRASRRMSSCYNLYCVPCTYRSSPERTQHEMTHQKSGPCRLGRYEALHRTWHRS